MLKNLEKKVKTAKDQDNSETVNECKHEDRIKNFPNMKKSLQSKL